MSVIERQRVVGKCESELDDLSCGICHNIFHNPVVTQCCRQTYCTICISQWLIDNKNCPNDCKPLDENGLFLVPKMVIQMINKLNIKCQNYEKCRTILTIEDMRNHSNNCYGIVCHSCEELRICIKNKDKKIERLKRELNSLKQRVDFKEVKPEIDSSQPSKQNEEYELKLAKRHIHRIESKDGNIPASFVSSLAAHCKNGFSRTKTFDQLSEYVQNKILARNKCLGKVFTKCLQIEPKKIVLSFGRLTIEAYYPLNKSKPLTVWLKDSKEAIKEPTYEPSYEPSYEEKEIEMAKNCQMVIKDKHWRMSDIFVHLLEYHCINGLQIYHNFSTLSAFVKRKLSTKTELEWTVLINCKNRERHLNDIFVVVNMGGLTLEAYYFLKNNSF